MILFLTAWLLQAPAPVLENDYVRVMRDAVMCATCKPAGAGIASSSLGDIELRSRSRDER
jgi:hypothetical protein